MSAQLAPQSADFRANAPLRLTRRGRLLLIGLPLMLAAAVALTLVGFFTAPAMAAAGGLGPGRPLLSRSAAARRSGMWRC